MAVVRLVRPALLLELTFVASALAADCAVCSVGPLGPPRCIPNGGILVFNSVPPNVPAYWRLFADARGTESLRRLEGELDVHSDAVDPGVPGFPGRLDGDVYVGTPARFAGVVRHDRVRGTATYPDGSTCRFSMKLAFGRRRANTFVCNDATGDPIAEGRIDLQGIRLRGCRRPRRSK